MARMHIQESISQPTHGHMGIFVNVIKLKNGRSEYMTEESG